MFTKMSEYLEYTKRYERNDEIKVDTKAINIIIVEIYNFIFLIFMPIIWSFLKDDCLFAMIKLVTV